jgi:hypothetical protein
VTDERDEPRADESSDPDKPRSETSDASAAEVELFPTTTKDDSIAEVLPSAAGVPWAVAAVVTNVTVDDPGAGGPVEIDDTGPGAGVRTVADGDASLETAAEAAGDGAGAAPESPGAPGSEKRVGDRARTCGGDTAEAVGEITVPGPSDGVGGDPVDGGPKTDGFAGLAAGGGAVGVVAGPNITPPPPPPPGARVEAVPPVGDIHADADAGGDPIHPAKVGADAPVPDPAVVDDPGLDADEGDPDGGDVKKPDHPLVDGARREPVPEGDSPTLGEAVSPHPVTRGTAGIPGTPDSPGLSVPAAAAAEAAGAPRTPEPAVPAGDAGWTETAPARAPATVVGVGRGVDTSRVSDVGRGPVTAPGEEE